MKNQHGLKLFFILSCCTAFLVAFAQVGAFAFSAIPEDSFADGIQLSTVDLSGKTVQEAAPLVKEAVRSWEEAETIKIVYRGKEQLLGSGSFQFYVEESLQTAVPGNVMLKVEVNREKLLESLKAIAPAQSADQFNLEKLSNQIISYASVLSEEAVSLDLQSYETARTNEETSLAVSEVKLPAETSGMGKLLEGIGSIMIPPVSQFSLNTFLDDHKQLQADPVLLNLVASGIYEVLLKTDFEVIERHMGSEIPDKERIGYDVRISQGNNMDLVVFNPNEREYTLDLSMNNGNLTVNLIGTPFTGKFEITIKTEKFKPKTIKRYSPLLDPDETKVEQEGKHGLIAIVTRNSFDQKGGLLNTELISEDFYPPVHKIEISGLKPGTTNTAPGAPNQGTIMLPGQVAPGDESVTPQQGSGPTPSSSGGEPVDVPANPSTGGEGKQEPGINDQKDSGNEKDSIWGKPNEDEK